MSDFETYSKLAIATATKSKCCKRKVGAVVVIQQAATPDLVYAGSNYNTEEGPCEVDNVTVSTVVHAEVAAINKWVLSTAFHEGSLMRGKIYVTHPPCEACLKMIDSVHLDVVIVEEFIKFDKDKLRYDLIPPETLKALATVLTFGAKKYKPNNWKNGETDRYIAAMYRHFEAWRLGETIAEDSREPHLAHALTNLMFIHFLSLKTDTES